MLIEEQKESDIMTWFEILKRQTTLDVSDEDPIKLREQQDITRTLRRIGEGVRSEKETEPFTQRRLEDWEPEDEPASTVSRSVRRKPKKQKEEELSRASGRKRREEVDTADASDVGETIREARAKLMREARGPYADIANRAMKLVLEARELPNEQKKLLGKVRTLLHEARIPEVKL